MTKNRSLIALDVGEKRIGVAVANTGVKIAVPYETIEVNGKELERIARIVLDEAADTLVVGYPRNQAGEPTAQTAYVEQFSQWLTDMGPEIVFQDESLTSILAEQQLQAQGGTYTKGDIDMQAAALILQDYMEQNV